MAFLFDVILLWIVLFLRCSLSLSRSLWLVSLSVVRLKWYKWYNNHCVDSFCVRAILWISLCVSEWVCERASERKKNKNHLANNNKIMGYHFRTSLTLSNELNMHLDRFRLITLLFVIWFGCCCCFCRPDKYDMQTKKMNGLLLPLFQVCDCRITTAHAIINAG